MSRSQSPGFALLESILAVVLLATVVLALAPALVGTLRLLARGRGLLEGTGIAQDVEARLQLAPGLCAAPAAGVDTGRFVAVHWAMTPGPGGPAFLAEIRDRGGRFPVESLAAVLRCVP